MTQRGEKIQPFLIFGSPLIEQAEIDEVVACMQSGWLGTDLRVAQFERDFAGEHGVMVIRPYSRSFHISPAPLYATLGTPGNPRSNQNAVEDHPQPC